LFQKQSGSSCYSSGVNQGNNRASAALRRLLRSLDVEVDPPEGTRVQARIGGHPYVFDVRWAGEGFPQDVRHLIASPPLTGSRELPVVAAHRMSRGSIELLEARGLSWVDERGHGRLSGTPGLLVAQGPSRSGTADRSGMAWTPSAGAVAELLLGDAARRSSRPVTDVAADRVVAAQAHVAERLQISPAQVSKVLRRFDENGWTHKQGPQRGAGASRVLADPAALLSSWAGWQSRRRPPTVMAHTSWQDARTFVVDQLVPRMPREAWHLTGWAAADARAPLATTVPTISCYVDQFVFDELMDDLLDRIGARRVETGARLVVLRSEPVVGALAHVQDGVPIVGDVRLYADLLALGVRGEDAADELRERFLGY
jgi:hypothetical protein